MVAVKGPVEVMSHDLEACMAAGGRPILWGPAGVGKSRMVEALARRVNRRAVTLIGSLSDPTDVNGFPVVNPNRRVVSADGGEFPVVELAPPRMFVDLNDGPPSILFLDELTTVFASVQASWLRLITDGYAGQYKLNLKKVWIIAAANPTGEAVNGQELAPPMVNRLDHYKFPVDQAAAVEWAEHFPTYWGSADAGWDPDLRPDGLELDHLVRARSYVAEFVRRVPTVWHPEVSGSRFTREAGDAGWPSPRSLDRAARHLAVSLARGHAPVSAMGRIAAAIGPGAAVEFQNFMTTMDIPDPEAVLADPDGWVFSGRVDLDYVVMQAVAAAVVARPTVDRVIAAIKVCERSVTKRDGGAVKEAGYAAMRLITPLFQTGTPKYQAMTKGMTDAQRVTYARHIQDTIRWFGPLVDLVKGKR